MFKLLKWTILAGGLAAVAWLVPLHGKTAVQRWRAAGSVSKAAEQGWSEARLYARGAVAREIEHQIAPRPVTQHARAPQRPIERHSERDRASLDRIIASRAK